MIIKAKRIYLEDGLFNGYLEIEGSKIINIYHEDADIKADIDYGNNRIIPGIFDTHNHGGFGYGFIHGETSEEDVINYLKGEASFGVVNVMPTTSNSKNMEIIAKVANSDYRGSKILGIHSEGPWGARVGEKGVNTGYPAVDLSYGQEMIDSAKGLLKLVDVAPEIEHGLDAISFFVNKGIKVGMYHTNANYQEACAGIDAGASVATHLGNVMTGLHHRDVGTLGACILSDKVDCEMICDGLHICLEMIDIYLRLKDHDKLMMVSDNVDYAGLPVGRYKGFGDSNSDRAYINITEDGFVLSDSGRLSGSSKPVIFGIKNLVEKLHVPMEECCKFFCYNPIRKYSDPSIKGSLKVGKDADMVVIDDDYNVLATYSEGKNIYDHNIDRVIINQKFIDEKKVLQFRPTLAI